MAVVEHVVSRPGWSCRRCGQPWPCSPARVRLAEQHAGDPTALSVLMGSHLYDAVAELAPLPPPAELFDRFLGWTYRAPPAAPVRPARPGNAARAFGWPTARGNTRFG